MRLPPLPADQWDEAVQQSLSVMLPPERRNPRDAGNALATLVRHPAADQRISAVQRPSAVSVHSAAAHPRAGDPACRASTRLRLRVDTPCEHRETRGNPEAEIAAVPNRRGPRRRVRPRRAHRRRRTRREVQPVRSRPGPRSASGLTNASEWTSSSRSAATSLLAMAINTFGVELETTQKRGKSLAPLPETSRGKLDRKLSRTGDRTGRLHRLDRSGILRSRARGDLQADVAQRRPSRAAAAHRQLFHQGAAVGGPGHVGDRRQDQGRRRSRRFTTSAATAETSWCGTTIHTRRPPAPAGSSPASTTPGATASTVI